MTTQQEFRTKKKGAFRAGLMISGAMALAGTALAQGPPTWQGPSLGDLNLEKKMLVGTCYSNSRKRTGNSQADGFVLAAFDTRDPVGSAGAIVGGFWATDQVNGHSSFLKERYDYHHSQWVGERLGEVFGVTLSETDTPDIFVASSSAYMDSFNTNGDWDRSLSPNNDVSKIPASNLDPRSKVYRINGVTGIVEDVVSLNDGTVNSSYPAELGNLCWMKSQDGNEWIFVSSLNDGMIYRIDGTNLQSTPLLYDHGVDGRPLDTGRTLSPIADNELEEVTSFGRRVWGVKYRPSDSRLYYAVWNDDISQGDSDEVNEIWSVELDPSTGAFIPSSTQFEFGLPVYSNSNGDFDWSMPVASIDFSEDGSTMLLAEREHRQIMEIKRTSPGPAHIARVLEYQLAGGSWVPEPVLKYRVGTNTSVSNSAGGVKIDCEDNVWVTGNFFTGTPVFKYLYGAQRIPAGGNETVGVDGSTSLWLDYDNNTQNAPKHGIGALAMYDTCACAEAVDVGFQFFEEDDPAGSVDLKITNTSSTGATWVSIIPGDGLDEICIDGISDARGHARVELDAELTMGEEFFLEGVTLKGAEPGEEVCFRVVLFDINSQTCCSEEICVTMPECFDWEVVGEPEVIEVSDSGLSTVKLCLAVTNLVDYSFFEWQILENFGAEIEPFVDFSFGRTEELKVTLPDVPTGGQYSFTLVLHSENYEECCSRTVTVEIPSGTDPSDEGWDMTLDDRVCCGGDEVAFANLSLANNGSEEIDLEAVLQEKPKDSFCEQFPLERVQFPGRDLEGNLVKFPVSAGEVVDQEIEIDCRGLDFSNGECYEFCISVTDGTRTQRTECIRIERCLDPIGAVFIGHVGVELENPVPFNFDLTNDSDDEVTFVWYVEPPIEGILIEGVNGFEPGQEQTLAAGEKLNVELQARVADGTLEKYPWLWRVFSFITVTVELDDEFGRRGILEIPFIVRDEAADSEELICVHSFECVEEFDVMKLTVSVMTPNSEIRIQQMDLATGIWSDIAFGTEAMFPAEFDSQILEAGTYEFFVDKNGNPRALYRVICTPLAPAGGGGSASLNPPGPTPLLLLLSSETERRKSRWRTTVRQLNQNTSGKPEVFFSTASHESLRINERMQKQGKIIHLSWAVATGVAFAIGLASKGGSKGASEDHSLNSPRSGTSGIAASSQSSPGSASASSSAGSKTAGGGREGGGNGLFGTYTFEAGGIEGLALQALRDSNPIVRRAAFVRLLEGMTPENADQIRTELEALGARGDQWREFNYSYGAMLGMDAVELVLDGPGELLRATMSGWTAADPEAALAMLANLPAGMEEKRNDIEAAIVYGLADTDRPRATAFVLEMALTDPDRAQGLIRHIAEEELRAGGPEGASNWIASLPDDSAVKGSALTQVINRYARQSPEDAASFVAGYADEAFAQRAIREVSERWAGRDPESTVSWLEDLPANDGQAQGFMAALGDWEDSDPEAAGTYLLNMPDSPQRDSAINGFAEGYAWQDPATALAWAEDISDPGMRNDTLTRVGQVYFSRNPTEAAAWLAGNDFPPEMVKQIQEGHRRGRGRRR